MPGPGPVTRVLGRLVFVTAVALQLYFVVRGYSDPHKHFAFQPFNEFDVWRADVVRVTYRGARYPVEQPWAGYTWSRLIQGDRGLDQPGVRKAASSGIRSLRVFLQQALDYVADHTPHDNETHHYEATLYYSHNGGPERVEALHSHPHIPGTSEDSQGD